MAACSNELVSQRAVFAEERGKQAALGALVRGTPGLTLVVCSTRKRCELTLHLLQGEGVTALDGNLSDKLKPREREAALQSFSSGATRVLLVCDAALKQLGLVGLGVPIAHVIGFDLPGMEARPRRIPSGAPHSHRPYSIATQPGASHAPCLCHRSFAHLAARRAPPQQYVERMSHVGRAGHPGVMSTLVAETASREALRQLAELLRETDNDVPRWLEGQATLAHSAAPEV